MTDQPQKSKALLMLSADQRKKLNALARIKSLGLDVEARDVLQDAHVRFLNSEAGDTPDETFEFLSGAINSIASNHRRRDRTVRRFEGVRATAPVEGADPIESALDPSPAQDDACLRNQIYEMCHDEDVRTLLYLRGDNATRASILVETGWDVTKYETVMKRMLGWGRTLLKKGML